MAKLFSEGEVSGTGALIEGFGPGKARLSPYLSPLSLRFARAVFWRAPTGLRSPAQGCGAAATLGREPRIRVSLNGVAPTKDKTPLGYGSFGALSTQGSGCAATLG